MPSEKSAKAEGIYPTEGDKYFAVVYLKNTNIDLRMADSKEEALSVLAELLDRPGVREKVDSTTVIKRDMGKSTDGYIFGHPQCLNLIKAENQ